jgi:hypothetical protein
LAVADRDPRSNLLAAKLRFLLEAAGIGDVSRTIDCPLGAAVESHGRTWILPGEARAESLGAALAWAIGRGTDAIGFVATRDAGAVARCAAHFTVDVEVRGIERDRLVGAEPAPHLPLPTLDPGAADLVGVIEAAGAEVIVDHPMLPATGEVPEMSGSTVSGEVSGLEVCRITAGSDPRIVIGVGAHDRDAFSVLHSGRDTLDALREVVGTVARHRRPDAEPHPLNRLAVSRMMRARARVEPRTVDARRCDPVAGPGPRRNLVEESPCAAIADDEVLTFVAGVDPEAVVFALDTAHRHDLAPRIVIRPRDEHPALVRLAAAARRVPVFTRIGH